MEQEVINKHWANISESQIPEVADYLIQLLETTPCLLFKGELGAGKTTLIKQLLKALHSTDFVSSPTYAIANEYVVIHENFSKVYHLDLYRIKDRDELLELGFEEYLYDKNAVCLIEWPEIAQTFWPENYSVIEIQVTSNGSRNISVHSVQSFAGK